MSDFNLLTSIDAQASTSGTSLSTIDTSTALVAGTVSGTQLQTDVVDDSNRNVAYRDNVGSITLLQTRVFHFRRNEITTGFTALMAKVADGHAFIPITAEQIYQISSTSSNDTNSAGTHARTVIVTGKNLAGNILTSSLNLAGQTGVNLVGSMAEVFKIQVASVGTFTNMNDGDIYVSLMGSALTAGKPDSDNAIILAMGVGQGEAYRPVRALKGTTDAGTIYLKKVALANSSDGTVNLRCDLFKNTVANAVKPVFQHLFQAGTTAELDLNYEVRIKESDLADHNLVWRVKDNGTAAPHEITAIVSYVYDPN